MTITKTPEWTPEPWRYEQSHSSPTRRVIQGALSGPWNDQILWQGLARTVGLSNDTDDANASRIVACVNGCAGLNPAGYRACLESLNELITALNAYFREALKGTLDLRAWEKHTKRGVLEAEAALTLARGEETTP